MNEVRRGVEDLLLALADADGDEADRLLIEALGDCVWEVGVPPDAATKQGRRPAEAGD